MIHQEPEIENYNDLEASPNTPEEENYSKFDHFFKVLAHERNNLRNDPNQLIPLLHEAGTMLSDRCYYEQAFLLFEECLQMTENAYGSCHPDLIPILNSMAYIEIAVAQYENAKNRLEKALELFNASEVPLIHSSAQTFRNYGLLNLELGNYKEALIMFDKAIEAYSECCVSSSLELAEVHLYRSDILIQLNHFDASQNDIRKAVNLTNKKDDHSAQVKAGVWASLGSLYLVQCKYKEAKETLENSLSLYEKLHMQKHLKTARVYELLASMYFDLSEYDNALAAVQESQSIYLELLTEKNPRIISTLAILGSIYCKKGEYAKAKTLLDKAYSFAVELFGEGHPLIANIWYRLANQYEEQSAYQEAMSQLEKSLQIYLEIYGTEVNCNISTIFNNMGVIHTKKNNLTESLESYKKALNITMKLFGEFHPDSSMIYMNIGILFGRKGDAQSQIEYYKKARIIDKQLFGKNHNEMASLYHNFGEAYTSLGQYEKAEKKFKKALNIKLRKYGPNHPSIALTYFLEATLMFKQGELAKAMDLLNQSLKIRLMFHDEKHLEVAKIYRIIGMIHHSTKNLTAAENYFHKSYQIRKELFGPNDPGVIYSKNKMAAIRKEKALKDACYRFDGIT